MSAVIATTKALTIETTKAEIPNNFFPFFGSDRSPRREGLVRACVRACVWDILQNYSESEF